jgi:hypothetical protein
MTGRKHRYNMEVLVLFVGVEPFPKYRLPSRLIFFESAMRPAPDIPKDASDSASSQASHTAC